MIVFSTVLEVEGNPILYSVYKNRSLAFLNPSATRHAPIIYASYEDSSWTIRGTEDASLKQQVINEIAITE